MCSSEDFERFYFSTKVRLCLMENLSNRFVSRTKSLITFFKSGLRILAKKVVEVHIDGVPADANDEKIKIGDQLQPVSKSSNDNPFRIWIDILISNGLHLSQKNLSYQDLVRMIEKLEGLCLVLPV